MSLAPEASSAKRLPAPRDSSARGVAGSRGFIGEVEAGSYGFIGVYDEDRTETSVHCEEWNDDVVCVDLAVRTEARRREGTDQKLLRSSSSTDLIRRCFLWALMASS